jgi:exodeoxyribonuclease III
MEPNSVKNSFSNGKYPGRILKAEYADFTLFNIYFPSGANSDKEVQEKKMKDKLRFYSQFLDDMERLSNSGENVVVCGDFNIAHNPIDLANPKRASKSPGFLPDERAQIDRLIEHGFNDSFRMFNEDPEQYTWWSYGHNSREKILG